MPLQTSSPRDYANLSIGGGNGIVRDMCVRDSHISCAGNSIGVHFGKNIANILFDTVGIYQVEAPSYAPWRFSSEYTGLGDIARSGIRFINCESLDNVVTMGYSDPNLDTLAFIRGGGATGTSRDKKFEYIMLSDGNNLGEYRKRFLRGGNIIGEIGIIPNAEMFLNSADPEALLTLKTSSQERMRFGKQGYLKANHIANYNNATALQHELSGSSSGMHILSVSNQSPINPNGLNINFSAAVPNNTTQSLITAIATGNTKFVVWSNGNVVNLNNSYGAISDGNLKDGVENAKSSWEEFKKYRFVNYYLKADPDRQKLLGVISQEIGQVSPGLVSKSPVMKDVVSFDEAGNEFVNHVETNETIKSVNYSVLYLKAAVALQEAIKRIEILEGKSKNLSD